MRIIISSHNFYPTHSGGTEVYVYNLIKYLGNNHEILLIAAVNENDVNSYSIKPKTVFRDSAGFNSFIYKWDDINVMGIEVKYELTKNISKYSLDDKHSYKEALNKIGWQAPDQYWIHGFTAVSGLSLLFALKENSPALIINAWMHTVFTCFKETWIKTLGNECNNAPDISLCTNCIYTSYFYNSVIGSASNKINNILFPILPLKLNKRKHVDLHLNSLSILVKYVNNWICFTIDVKNQMVMMGIEDKSIIYQRHGIDTSIFNTNGRKNSSFSNVRFLYTGRWLDIKGFYLLCKAWAELPQDKSIRTLSITGDLIGNETDYQISLIERLKNRDDVIWLGKLSQMELADKYKEHDVVLIPSLWYETGPMVYHEAIACGCNVISTNIGGCKELAIIYKQYTFPPDHIIFSKEIKSFVPKKLEVFNMINHDNHFSKILSQLI